MAGVKNEIYNSNRGGGNIRGGDTRHYEEKFTRKRIFKE